MDKDTETELVNDHEIPYSFDESKKIIRWVRLKEHTFTDPFFYDTIQTCLLERQEQKETSLEQFLNTTTHRCVPPKVFIFHISRCGSTLLTQMLAQSSRNIVLSEPTIFDDLLLSNLAEDEKRRALLKSLEMLGCKRNGIEENLIVKLDCWHLLYVDFIKRTFPGVPIVFLIREPSEVLMSHRKMRGRQMVPGLLKIQLVTAPIPAYDLEGHALKVLERFYSIIYSKCEPENLLMDYSQLPEGLHLFLKTVRLTFNEAERQHMLNRAMFHSKDPLSPIGRPEPVEPVNNEQTAAVHKLYAALLNKTVKE